ncbi:MAG: beta strand repeat-containing protein, partial [Planctomycetaceae bacterium]
MLRLEDRRVFNASLALTGVQLVGGENLTVSAGGQQDVGSGSSVETVRLEITEGTWSIDGGISDTQYDLLTGDKVLLLDAQFFLNNPTTSNSLPIQGSVNQSDHVTINVSGLTVPAGDIIFVGGEDASNADNDRLTIEGYAIDQDNNPATADVLVVHEGPEKGRVELAGIGNIRFEELEPLSLNGTAEDLRIQLPTGDDPNVVLSDNGSATDSISRIDGDGFELTDFRNPTGSLTISDSSGVKQIFVRGLDPAFQADLQLQDTALDNTVTFEQQELETGGGSLTVDGDKIRFFTNVRTFGGHIDLTADSEIFSTTSSQLNTSAAADSGASGGSVSVSLESSGTASFLGGIITTGADSSADNGGAGGDVTITTQNGTLAVAAINTSGGRDLAGSRRGGDAGDILLATGGNNILLNSDLTAVGGVGQTPGSGGGVDFDGPVRLETSVSISTGGTAGDIRFRNTIQGSQPGQQNLTLAAGTGNVILLAAAGQNIALGQFTIQSATDVTLRSVIAGGLKQEAGTGLTTLAGPVTTTGPAGIDLQGRDLRIEKMVITQTDGGVATRHTGTVTILSEGYIQSDGVVSIAANSVSTAAGIGTSSDDLTIEGGVTLTASVTLSTGTGGGNIQLTGPINGTSTGSQNLTFAAGTGSVTLLANAGQNTALGQITIQSATDVTLQSVLATGLKQEAGTGLTTLAGPVTTTGVA